MGGFTSIFHWIVTSSIMASGLIGLILFAKLIFKNRLSANWHYYIWFLLIIRLIIPYGPKSSMSIFNIIAKDSINNVNYFISENIDYNILEKQDDKLKPHNESLGKHNEKQHIYNHINEYESIYNKKMKFNIMILWITGVLILLGYTVVQNIKLLYHIKGTPQHKFQWIDDIFEECKDMMDINKNIHVVVTTKVTIPSLFGIIRPKILFPENLLEKVSNEQLKHIFLHELAHFKRKDILINWVIVFLQILHWFNPIVWLGFYKMHNDCEIACDFKVLCHIRKEERKEYGYTIIYLLNVISNPTLTLGSTGILFSKYYIKRRIVMISIFKKGSFLGKVMAVLFFIGIGFLGLTNAVDIDNIKASPNVNINENNKITEGQGVVITLSDKSNIEKQVSKNNPYESLVFLPDIAEVMNTLNNAGAKAISLNDEKITDVTKMKVDGIFINVNGKKIGNPFVIKAIGDVETLENSLISHDGILNKIKERKVRIDLNKKEKILISEIKKINH